MQSEAMEKLARRLAVGELSVEEFLAAIAPQRSLQLDSATLDLDRQRRCGFPEVIYGEGKTNTALVEIARALSQKQMPILATRLSTEQAAALMSEFPQGHHNGEARTFRQQAGESEPAAGQVAVITAGTCDRPVAEEARETLQWMGVETKSIDDVGVAGPHRLVERVSELADVDAVVVVAGMEGALPSVVAGHVACPVIAVPTSVGYGANFGGAAALLSMLNSCAANVCVVNIDAGFKGAYVAGLIASRRVTQ